MCGICGEFNYIDEKADPENISKMMDTLVHRGPDDCGMYCRHSIGLGHRRLSIIDLSVKGRQPIWSEDRSLCIVFNGEVYNYREIKADLITCGYRFESDTDTEVVINAIHCYGIENALKLFIGMFAFALWDSKLETLTLCRDRAGIKPLYYYMDEKRIIFGSELKAIMQIQDLKKNLIRSH
jgi:asparagine synthase (glutamine-hydrolysing)